MDDSNVIELIGKVMVATVLMLLFVVIFLFVFHICNKPSSNASTAAATATLFQFVAHGGGYEEDLTPLRRRRGLDPSVLKSIPMVSAEEMKEKLECAVCLCNISEGEKARLLPKCNHGFHVECIDMWFQSNCTCPVCRNPVSDLSNLSSSGLESTSIGVETTINEESSNLPTNSLFMGNDTHLHVRSEFPQASASSSTSTSNYGYGGMLVIDIPLQINEAAVVEEEEANPPPPAPPMRLSSFKRLLVRDTRVSSCCPSDFDGQQETRS